MPGMNQATGEHLIGIAHLRQSIVDILTTPLGSRVMRRDYGSRLYQLVDAPVNRAFFVEVYSAVAEALIKWEPRFQLTRVQVDAVTAGRVLIALEGMYVPEGNAIILEGLIV
jgi:phage baseplate assembly protein W